MSTQNLRIGDKVIAISNSDAQKYKISDKGKVVKRFSYCDIFFIDIEKEDGTIIKEALESKWELIV